MSNPRLMFLCGQSPWLQNGGALIRNYWMISALSRRFTIDLVTAEAPAGPMPAEFAGRIDDYACLPRSERVRAGWGRALAAACPSESSLTAGWTSPALREYVAERLGRFPYAAIQVDLPMWGALPRRDAIPIVYNAHNCEYELLSRRAQTEPPHVSVAMALDAMRVKRIESALMARAALVAACSESDVRDFERFCPDVRRKAVVVPNGVDIGRYAALGEIEPSPRTVLITGSMDWRPNLHGLLWMLRNVLPPLVRRIPDISVRVAGRMKPGLAAELERFPNVRAVPNPETMEPLLAQARVVAAPILASSGTRLRILEAWASSRPVVTTTPGAAGLDHAPGVDLLVADTAGGFADAIARLLAEPQLARTLTENARLRVARYGWTSIGATLLGAYERSVVPLRARIDTVSEDVVLAARL